MLSKQADRKL